MDIIEKLIPFLRPLIFLMVWIIFYYWQPSSINVYDEGLILTGAFRILSGEIPSADFYTNYGPAQFYIVAAAMELFGRNADSGRLIHSLILALTLLASYKLMLCSGISKNILYPLGLIFILLLYFGTLTPLYPAIACIPLMLFGCILIIRLFDSQIRLLSFVPIALLVTSVFLFRYDVGLMAIVSFAAPLVFFHPGSGSEAKLGFIAYHYPLIQYGVVVSAVLLLVLACLFSAGILHPALQDILTYNGKNYVEMRSLPFPSPRDFSTHPIDTLSIYLPILSAVMGIIVCATYYIPSRADQDRCYLIIFTLTVVVIGCFAKGLVRTHPIHMLLADVPALILLVLCFRYSIKNVKFKYLAFTKSKSVAFSIGFFLIVVFAVLHDMKQDNSILYRSSKPSDLRYNIPVLGSLSVDAPSAEAIKYLAEAIEPDERVLLATGRHDKVFANDLSMYYLAQRLPGTRWHHYDPGVQTTEKVQLEMIRDLEQYSVNWVVVNSKWDGVEEPNKSAESSGVFWLDTYISENYTRVVQFGPFEIRRRRS